MIKLEAMVSLIGLISVLFYVECFRNLSSQN